MSERREYLDHIDSMLLQGAFKLTHEDKMAIREVYNAVLHGDLVAAREAWEKLPPSIAHELREPPGRSDGPARAR